MAIIDDIIDTGLTDEDIIGLLKEKRRERQKVEEERARAERARAENARIEKERSEEAARIAEIEKRSLRETIGISAATPKGMDKEQFDTVIYRIGQLVNIEAKQRQELNSIQDKFKALPVILQILQKFETEICNLHSKSDQILRDGISIRENMAIVQDKQDNIAQDVERIQIIKQTGDSNRPNNMQQQNNVQANVNQEQEAEMMSYYNPQSRQTDFNPYYQPNGAASTAFNNHDDQGYHDYGNNDSQTATLTNSGTNQVHVQGQPQDQHQNQGSNLMPKANNGLKQLHQEGAKRGKKFKNVYENSNMKSIPGMPQAQVQVPPPDHAPEPQTFRTALKKNLIPNKMDPTNPTVKAHWEMSPSQIEAQKEKFIPGQWQGDNYPQREVEKEAEKPPGFQKQQTNEEKRCAKEILFFGEKEPLYVNKKQYDRDLFDVIVGILAEVSTTHLDIKGFNVKEGDIVRVRVIHAWTGSEKNKPMLATFRDVETCNRAKRAIKLGNFYKRRTHSKFGKYKITGDQKTDDENRKRIENLRHKFARPSTPKAVREKRQKEREERNNNEDYRREKEEEKEKRDYERERTVDSRTFAIKKFDITENVNEIEAIKKLAVTIDEKVNKNKNNKKPTVHRNNSNVEVANNEATEGYAIDKGNTETTETNAQVSTVQNVLPGGQDANEEEHQGEEPEHSTPQLGNTNVAPLISPSIDTPQMVPPQQQPILRPRQLWWPWEQQQHQQQQQRWQQQQQQQRQQGPRTPFPLPWNINPDGSIIYEQIQIKQPVGLLDQNGNKTGEDIFSTIKSWSDRIEEEEQKEGLNYMDHTQTTPPMLDNQKGEKRPYGRTALPGTHWFSPEETEMTDGRTALLGIHNASPGETEKAKGRTAPPEQATREETEMNSHEDMGNAVSASGITDEKSRGSDVEIIKDTEDPNADITIIMEDEAQEDSVHDALKTPQLTETTRGVEDDVVGAADDDEEDPKGADDLKETDEKINGHRGGGHDDEIAGRTALPAETKTSLDNSQQGETDTKKEDAAILREVRVPTQTNQDMQSQDPNISAEMFLSEGEEEHDAEPEIQILKDKKNNLEVNETKSIVPLKNDSEATTVVDERDDKENRDDAEIGENLEEPLEKGVNIRQVSLDRKAASSRHNLRVSSNAEISRMVNKTIKVMKDRNDLGIEIETPEKVVTVRKPMGMLDINHKRHSTRSKSNTRMKENIGKDNV